MKFFKTSKYQISEISKTGFMEPVLQTDFVLRKPLSGCAKRRR
jgi:hypothetical protein